MIYLALIGLASCCVFDKQSPGSFLCGRDGLVEQVYSPSPAPLLPKLRGQFAEFLNKSSLARLRIFILSTCVGFGTVVIDD